MKCSFSVILTVILLQISPYRFIESAWSAQLEQEIVKIDNFQYRTKGKVLVIGDLQGDFHALVQILMESHLIDENLKWIGKNNEMVLLMGDLFGGKKGTRYIVELIMEHQNNIKTVLGNHELLVASGNLSKMPIEEQDQFILYPIDGITYENPYDAIRFSKFGKWMESLNQFIIINNNLFVHAGLDPKFFENRNSLMQNNELVQTWIKYWFNAPPRTLLSLASVGYPQTVFGDPSSSPSWLRLFKGNEDSIPSESFKEKFNSFLNQLNLKHMFIGHNPTVDGRISLYHSVFGNKVISMDTRISDKENGTRSALWIHPNGRLQPVYFQRNKEIKKLSKNYINLKRINSTSNSCLSVFN